MVASLPALSSSFVSPAIVICQAQKRFRTELSPPEHTTRIFSVRRRCRTVLQRGGLLDANVYKLRSFPAPTDRQNLPEDTPHDEMFTSPLDGVVYNSSE